MKRFLLSSLFLVLLLFPAGRAGAEELPEAMRGVWGLPDCGDPMDMVIYSRRHILSVTDDEACLQLAEYVGEGENYILIGTGHETFMSRTTNDGLLEEIYPDDQQLRDTSKSWEELANGQRFEYAHCDEPAIKWYRLHGAGIMLMEHIDAIVDECRGGLSESCKHTLFDIADDNDDGVLEDFEISSASKIVHYLATISHEGGVARTSVEPAMKTADAQGPVLADAVIMLADTDESGTLTPEELDGFWQKDSGENPAINAFRRVLDSAGDYFAFLKPPQG